MSRRPFPPEYGLATPVTAVRAQCPVEALSINCDHTVRLDRGALIALGCGSVPLILALRPGIARARCFGATTVGPTNAPRPTTRSGCSGTPRASPFLVFENET